MKVLLRTILFLLISISFFSCKEEEKIIKEVLRPVKYKQIGFTNSDLARTFNGTAKTDKEIKLSFRNNGIITKFLISVGKSVKKGELLAQLDNVQARLSYQQALSSLNTAKSQKNTAKSSYDRIRSLYEKGSVSLSEFESAKNSYVSATDSYASAQKSVKLQQAQLNYGIIYAPENGVIASVNTEVNENVTAGQLIGVLNAGKKMEVSVGIPESVINSIKKGMKTTVSFSSLGTNKFIGKVIEVSPSIDQNTATYLTKIEIEDSKNSVKSGMAADVTFDFKNAQDSKTLLIAPINAVGEDSNGRFVFVIDSKDGKTGVVKKQKVTIGKLSSKGFEILEGLSSGQKIATAGLQTLLNGQKVKLQ